MMNEQFRSGQHTPLDTQAIPLEHIYAAYQRSQGIFAPTPLVRLPFDSIEAEVYLKLEMLQPVGSFKVRGAAAALTAFDRATLGRGVWTASAGNMGYALAWCARRMGTRCAVIVPDDAPAAKVNAIRACNAQIHAVPFSAYQRIQATHAVGSEIDPAVRAALDGMTLVHPFEDEQVMAGNGGIGLEILEALPEVTAVLVPYGGGGLSCGIASALRALRPQAQVLACEVETAAPLSASLAAGQPVEVNYTPSFISGMGAPFVFPRMWPRAQALLHGTRVVTLDAVRRAVRQIAERVHVITEGAGAVAAAAALGGGLQGKIVCVASGGNIDPAVLSQILMDGDCIHA